MVEQIKINQEFMAYLNEITIDLIVNKIEDRPEDAPVFMAVNDMLNKINYDGTKDLSKLLGDDLINDVLEELKSNM